MQKAAEYFKSREDECNTCKAGTVPPSANITFSEEHLLNRKRSPPAVAVDKSDYPVILQLIKTVPCDSAVSIGIGCARFLEAADAPNGWTYNLGYTTF